MIFDDDLCARLMNAVALARATGSTKILADLAEKLLASLQELERKVDNNFYLAKGESIPWPA